MLAMLSIKKSPIISDSQSTGRLLKCQLVSTAHHKASFFLDRLLHYLRHKKHHILHHSCIPVFEMSINNSNCLRIVAASSATKEAGSYIPAAPILLPEGTASDCYSCVEYVSVV
ncbi:hypothetical protein Leryth_011084 [Lithospermum erythrorhizon]|nr:hypothetical protein Leryth_011084 [Lithospermum erythrorhizon]